MDFLNQTIDKYKLVRLIGEGGMAYVYEGIHERLGTRVAVKILNPVLSVNQQIRIRFENEVKLLASLDHPNIIKVIHYEETPHVLAIVMEYLSGNDLNTSLQRKEPFTKERIKHIFSQIMSAFQYAHRNGVVHRDIKPSNIFITESGQVKILDFGIAKIYGTGADMTSTGTQMGTPVYMSPEQVKGDRSIDHRSDIYSLGVTFYTLLNGKPPYDSLITSQFDIFNQIVYQPLPPIKGHEEFSAFIEKAVEKDRQLRFQSIDEMIIAFEKIVGKSDHAKSGTLISTSNTVSAPTIIDSTTASSITSTASLPAGISTSRRSSNGTKIALFITLGVLGLGLLIGITMFIYSRIDSSSEGSTYYSGDRSESSESDDDDTEMNEAEYPATSNDYITDTVMPSQMNEQEEPIEEQYEPAYHQLSFNQNENLCVVYVYVDDIYIGQSSYEEPLIYLINEGRHHIVYRSALTDDMDIIEDFYAYIDEDMFFEDVGELCDE